MKDLPELPTEHATNADKIALRRRTQSHHVDVRQPVALHICAHHGQRVEDTFSSAEINALHENWWTVPVSTRAQGLGKHQYPAGSLEPQELSVYTKENRNHQYPAGLRSPHTAPLYFHGQESQSRAHAPHDQSPAHLRPLQTAPIYTQDNGSRGSVDSSRPRSKIGRKWDYFTRNIIRVRPIVELGAIDTPHVTPPLPPAPTGPVASRVQVQQPTSTSDFETNLSLAPRTIPTRSPRPPPLAPTGPSRIQAQRQPSSEAVEEARAWNMIFSNPAVRHDPPEVGGRSSPSTSPIFFTLEDLMDGGPLC
ncbi:hypothetical protein B0H10DRAFT_1948577 [Mycena sp. CBHHK59/15]|nr:hypothetical protein B0H10DRAFT_1948577 [Mycena sp. CBHHK59/15]